MLATTSSPWCWFVSAFLVVLLGLAARPAKVLAHDVPAEMAEAASRFLRALDDRQREQVSIDFKSQRRTLWHYIPSSMLESQGGRRGLAIKEMSPEQRALAHALLNTALSHRGYFQAMTVMLLEAILRDLQESGPTRDPQMYHLAIYGKPSTDATWGWSFEGHHLSVNVTLVDGQRFSVTPSFFGSNPAVVRKGPFEGLETLAPEQQLARELVRSLTPEQRKLAVIAAEAPRDIITGAEPHVGQGGFEPPQGIAFDKLDANQRKLLLDLVGQFATKYREPILDQIAERTPIIAGHGMHFAWAGGFEPGEGHYYRVQTPHFLFEYDNTQNGANHVHAVWRQFDGDFGADLLRQHYETSPHHQHSDAHGHAHSDPE
jgi:hypothetical protein